MAELQHTLDERLRRSDLPAPPGLSERMKAQSLMGLSIAVIHGGRIHWAQAFGEGRAGVPATADTRFQAGSVSKPFAALGALRLAEATGVGFDDDLRASLKGWQPPPEAEGSAPRYTLRRLLSHSAGLSQHGFPGYAQDALQPTLAQILDGLPPANTEAVRPVLPAGQAWRYSGGGSTIAQLWVESRSGEPFAQAQQRLLLQPLGLQRSHFGPPPAGAAAADYAQSHQGRTPEPGGWRIYPEQAAAGLWTTPSDIATLLLAVQRAAAGEPGVISPAIAKAATEVVLAPSSMGFFIDDKPARFGHNGSNQGFESLSFAFKDRGEGLVLMANGQNNWPMFEAIVRTMARIYDWPGLAATEAARDQGLPHAASGWVGDYSLPGGKPLRVRLNGGQLWLERGPGDWKRLWRDADGRFGTDDGLQRLTFSASGLHLPDTATPLPRQALSRAKLPTVYLRGSFNQWQTGQALKPVAPGRWRTELELPAGRHEFKLGDADWALVNLGGERQEAVTPGRQTLLTARGSNLLLDLPSSGGYRVDLRFDDSPAKPSLQLTRL